MPDWWWAGWILLVAFAACVALFGVAFAVLMLGNATPY